MPITVGNGAPRVRLVGLSRVYDPGCHCAFTDLAVWRGRIWLAFREAVMHGAHPSGQILVMSSADHGHTFQLQARIATRGLDVRDPHFFVVDDRLHIVIPSVRLPEISNCTIIARSDDGLHWELFRDIPAFQDVIVWRPRPTTERGVECWYAACYREDIRAKPVHDLVRLARTTDGVDWEHVSDIHDTDSPNETELCFLPDGDLLALIRLEKPPYYPLIARSSPPYRGPWQKVLCDRLLQGPLLERFDDGRFMVVGRGTLGCDQFDKPVTQVFTLDPASGRLSAVLTLESGGDTSYAGFVRLPDEAQEVRGGVANALVSYYSHHGYDSDRSAIYVARVVI